MDANPGITSRQEELDEFRERWRKELRQHPGTGGEGKSAPQISGTVDSAVNWKRRRTEKSPTKCDQGEKDKSYDTLKATRSSVTSDTIPIWDMLLQGKNGCSTLNRKCEEISGDPGRKSDDVKCTYAGGVDRAELEEGEAMPAGRSENLIDKLISDLDEINEIPFFDIELPRELAMKIFENLNMQDLLSCAQVSSSWRSLADDDILWCRICHGLGYHADMHPSETRNWKKIVQDCLSEDQTLRANWKGRIGGVLTLEYVRGGILSAVQSHCDRIISGYSGGSVKLWDINSNDSEVLLTSHESIGLDHKNRPSVDHVALNSSIAMATYDNDDVDIWNLCSNSPTLVHHFSCNQSINCVAMATDDAVVATATGHSVRVEATDENGTWYCKCTPSADQPVTFMKFVPKSSSNLHIVMATENAMGGIYYYPVGKKSSPDRVIKLHQLIAPVSCLDVNSDLIACGVGSTGFQEGFLVKILDLEMGKVLHTLHGHNWGVSSLNLADSPPNMIVTGCRDKKVRVFDFRSGEWPVMSVQGHGGSVTAVQMDDWKAVSGGFEGMLCVWDLRMKSKLWETYARHPVRHCHFDRTRLISAHIPQQNVAEDDFEIIVHKRQRGDLRVYNFLLDEVTSSLPSICQSNYDEPEGYNYNIKLAVPYDNI
ncbi:F-box/WD repeat-containing protein 8-like isoform X2 [Ptychodera flava]|uniref:F-box/WD repeat-containing protein 8-like isoform X1 n=1 Tax=Ptychodera flava TaxID=63121 RepID=UPI00396A9BC1